MIQSLSRKIALIVALTCLTFPKIQPAFSSASSTLSEERHFMETSLMAKYVTWNIFKEKRGRKNICYILAKPIETKGTIYERGESYFVVTHMKNNSDEINVVNGFNYKENSKIELSFGAKKFYLMPYIDRGWTNNIKDDINIIKELQRNEEVIVTSYSKTDSIISDTYSLIGFPQAYRKMKQLCQ